MLAGRKFLVILFAWTLLASLKANASEDVKLTEIKETQSSEETPPKGLEDMRATPVPKVSPTESGAPEQIYFPYQNALSPRLGIGSTAKRLGNNEFYHLYGLQYQFPSEHATHWEAGVDVWNDGTGSFSAGLKKRINPTEAVRPYYKLGLAVRVDPSEQLTTFLRNENYQIRPAAGFEYFLEHPSSVRLEVESWIALRELGFHFCLGYSYAW